MDFAGLWLCSASPCTLNESTGLSNRGFPSPGSAFVFLQQKHTWNVNKAALKTSNQNKPLTMQDRSRFDASPQSSGNPVPSRDCSTGPVNPNRQICQKSKPCTKTNKNKNKTYRRMQSNYTDMKMKIYLMFFAILTILKQMTYKKVFDITIFFIIILLLTIRKQN